VRSLPPLRSLRFAYHRILIRIRAARGEAEENTDSQGHLLHGTSPFSFSIAGDLFPKATAPSVEFGRPSPAPENQPAIRTRSFGAVDLAPPCPSRYGLPVSGRGAYRLAPVPRRVARPGPHGSRSRRPKAGGGPGSLPTADLFPNKRVFLLHELMLWSVAHPRPRNEGGFSKTTTRLTRGGNSVGLGTLLVGG